MSRRPSWVTTNVPWEMRVTVWERMARGSTDTEVVTWLDDNFEESERLDRGTVGRLRGELWDLPPELGSELPVAVQGYWRQLQGDSGDSEVTDAAGHRTSGARATPATDSIRGSSLPDVPLRDIARAVEGFGWSIRERTRLTGISGGFTVNVPSVEYEAYEAAIIGNMRLRDSRLDANVRELERAEREGDKGAAKSAAEEIYGQLEQWVVLPG